MKNKNAIRILFILAVLVIYAGCTDEPMYRSDSFGEISDGPLKEMKDYFEDNAAMLRQVSLGNASDARSRNSAHSHTCDASCEHGFSGSENLIPSWDKAKLWEGERELYAEVPLKGKGIYKAALISSSKGNQTYPVRSYLLLIQDKESGSINYTVVTVMSQSKRYVDHPSENTLGFVGNSDFKGFVIFSKLDGTCYRALHLFKGKSHPVFIGSSNASTRSAAASSDNQSAFSISLASSSQAYNDGELDKEGNVICGNCKIAYKPDLSLACPKCFQSPGNIVRCAFCNSVYDLDEGGCLKGCDVEISGEPKEVECPYCKEYYDAHWNSCPKGCAASNCFICNSFPCKCYQYRCGRCLSVACPGPWQCSLSGGDDKPVNPIPVAPKAKKIFRNSNMTEENWKQLEKMLDKIMKDCLGEGLYICLETVLGGKTLPIQFSAGSNGGFNLDGGGIIIGKQMESNQLLHEMMHAFQAYHTTVSGFADMTMNFEFEAHYVQYLYLKKLAEYKNSEWEQLYKNSRRHEVSAGIQRYVDDKGRLIGPSSGLTRYLDTTVLSAFQETNTYKNYTYNNTFERIDNFSRLNKITKNCH